MFPVMKALIITASPSDSSPAGGARVLAEALDSHSVSCQIFAPADTPGPHRADVRIVPDHQPIITRDDGLTWILQYNAALLEHLSHTLLHDGPAVVYARGWQTTWAAAAVHAAHGAGVIACPEAPAPPGETIAREAERWLVSIATAILRGRHTGSVTAGRFRAEVARVHEAACSARPSRTSRPMIAGGRAHITGAEQLA